MNCQEKHKNSDIVSEQRTFVYCRQQNILDKVNAVMYCRFEVGRYCGNDFLVRSNIDHITAVADCGISTVPFHFRE